MICARCGEPINHRQGDMIVQIRAWDVKFDKMCFCLSCVVKFCDWIDKENNRNNEVEMGERNERENRD